MWPLKSLLPLLALIVWPFAAGADVPPPQFPSKDVRTVADSYVGPEGKAEVSLILTHVGAYLPEARERQRTLARLASDFRLKVDRVYHGQLAFLRVSDRFEDRDRLIALVRELRAKAEGTGISFGLAYREGEAGSIPSVSTDEVIAGVRKDYAMEELVAAMQERGYALLAVHPYLKTHAVFAAANRDDVDLMAAARRIVEETPADFAYPNFTAVSFDTETLLNDTRFGDQWHLRNTGQNGGTVDADADLSLAWDITLGAAGTVIAIHENGGFDTPPNGNPVEAELNGNSQSNQGQGDDK